MGRGHAIRHSVPPSAQRDGILAPTIPSTLEATTISPLAAHAIGYEAGAGRKRELAVRRSEAQRIAETPVWVTEGIYLWWCESLGERADRIIWLDVAWGVAVYRIVLRHILLSLAGTNRHPGLRNLARFVWGTRGYYRNAALPSVDDNDDGAVTRGATETWLRSFGTKVIRCGTARDTEVVVAALTDG